MLKQVVAGLLFMVKGATGGGTSGITTCFNLAFISAQCVCHIPITNPGQ